MPSARAQRYTAGGPTESFEESMNRMVNLTTARFNRLFDRVDAHVGQSIKYGSPITGAPGQPVDTGDLLKSWRKRVLGQNQIMWFSDLVYAPIIEDNLRGAQLRSSVGGFHSVKMTRAGFRRIVSHELAIVKGQIKAGNVDSKRKPYYDATVGRMRGPGGFFVGSSG